MERLSHVLVVVVAFVSGLSTTHLPAPPGSPSPVHTDSNGGLLLTAYITSNDNNQIEMAKNLSVVQPFPQFPDVTSYAGYITVDQATDSNLFFCFIKATIDSKNAPVLLTLNGGPGITSFHGLYNGVGPFYVDSDLNLVKNNCSSNTKVNTIYLDAPAGGGFSYTKSYAKSDSEVAKQIHTFLHQFFTLFNEYSANDFYILGGSYAAKFAVEEAWLIIKNKGKDPIRINFKGIVSLSGFIDPPNMISKADTLYSNGLINEAQRDFLSSLIDIALTAMSINKFAAALIALIANYFIAPMLHGSLSTEFPNFYSTLIQSDDFRARFHIGKNTLHQDEGVYIVASAMVDTLLTPSTTALETILDNNYKVCLLNGQRDVTISPVAVRKFVTGLRWHGAEAYNVTSRLIWTAPNETIVSGYVTQVFNLWEIMVSNSRHAIIFDQPCTMRDALDNFFYNKKFT